MKNIIILFLLLTVVVMNSCKDKNNEPDGFQPSLDLEEYVLINVNGDEWVFTSENNIEVTKEIDNNGLESIRIFFLPQPVSFTHFILEINEPVVGDFTEDKVNINYLNFPVTDEFSTVSLNCTSSGTVCDGEIYLTIHELGTIGEKMIGEMSGTVTTNEEVNEFTGEFVVYIDQ